MLGPIFVREWLTVPRRPRNYAIRTVYLILPWMLGITAWQMLVGWGQTATLGDAARFGARLFQLITTWVELPLVIFFSALTAATAVSREKDRRTFVLLLMTDMRNYQIVLGKFLGSMLQLALLMTAMIPIMCLLLLLGGIAPQQVLEAVVVVYSSAFAAGALGVLIALWRDKTFQTLAMTVLAVVLYLCMVEALAVLPWAAGKIGSLGDVVTADAVETAQGWLGPWRALRSVLDPVIETESGTVSVTIPAAYGYAACMMLLTVLLNVWGILRLRVWNPSGEPIMQRERPEDVEAEEKDRAKAHAAPGMARAVWENPILWRETRTRAYGRRPFLVKFAYFLAAGMLTYFAVAGLSTPDGPSLAIYVLVLVGVLSLLLVSAQAVTAITTERDGGALDLLLVTDLSPNEFIFGKLLGILYNTKEYLLPPLALAVAYACLGLLATPARSHPEMWASKNTEAGFALGGAILLLLGFAAVLGVHVALRNENSTAAIVNTLGTVFFLSFGTGVCVVLIIINGRRFEAQWFSFIFFLAAGIGGLWWVLSGERPSSALTLASFLLPIGVFYTVTNILVGKPGSIESADPLVPFLVIAGSFGLALAAMLVPLLSEFDVALGRTTGGQE